MGDRRVLQLLGPSTGGIRQHVAQLAAVLPDLGWEVTVAGPVGVGAGTALPPIAEVPVPRGASPIGAWHARRALAPLVGEVDVVHAHGLKAGWVAALTPRRAPLVVTVHNLVLDEAAGRSAAVLRLLEGALPRRVDALIAVSDGIATRFGDPPPRVVPPAGPPPVPVRDRASVRAAHDIPEGAPLVVAVARLHPQKDLASLIDAVVPLRALVPDARLVIVGEGPLAAELQAQIDRAGLGNAVTLVGPSANAADELAAADVVAISSIWESGPLVAAEALQLARPVVATPVGFVPRLIQDGRSGRLVPARDPDAMARALADVLRDPASAAVMAAAGRERALELLSPRSLVAAVAEVYEEVLAGAGRSR